MKLSEFKQALTKVDQVSFLLPNGKQIPLHAHITEVGEVNKRFIDCGGTLREEKHIAMQLWYSVDVWHRLKGEKVISIIKIAEDRLGITDQEIVVEYQGETIESYGLEFNGSQFQLTQTQTACLATDQCGITIKGIKNTIKEKAAIIGDSCGPGANCC